MIGHATSCTTFCPCLVGCQKIPCTSFNSCKSPGSSLAQIHNYFLLEPKCNWLVFLEIHFFVPLDYFPWNHLISCQLVIEQTYRVFNCKVVDFIIFRECLNPWELSSEPGIYIPLCIEINKSLCFDSVLVNLHTVE